MDDIDARLADHSRKVVQRLRLALELFANSGLDPQVFPAALIHVGVDAYMVVEGREAVARALEKLAARVRAGPPA